MVRIVKERGNWHIANITCDCGESLADPYRAMSVRQPGRGQNEAPANQSLTFDPRDRKVAQAQSTAP